MTDDDDFELIRGSGNVYADLGLKEPEQRQLRAIRAAEISNKANKTPTSDFDLARKRQKEAENG